MLCYAHSLVVEGDLDDDSYENRLDMKQAARICQLQLEMLSCNRLLDVKKDLKCVTDILAPWL